jgi:glyoxylase-like metal-dependent hydrolase (beta-lactamase superfamily II)
VSPECPQVSQVAPAVQRVTGGVTNFCLVEEGDSSRWSMPAPWGTGDLLQRALSAQGGVLEAVVPTHVHADHTGFAERARTKADAPVWVHQADAAVAKGAKPGKLTPHRG